ncbi:hypothetical protein E1A91_A11G089700v1 [Gossypium mustelinum]|uniref:Uncharacterized protein n=1 Tax=Gossypium mustelinum TaxID=34275 RepID=A0A5D2X482_GOSMU|nr:hypothetical protein E1A91_A11G089700v1 [Gossypium mustelinum]
MCAKYKRKFPVFIDMEGKSVLQASKKKMWDEPLSVILCRQLQIKSGKAARENAKAIQRSSRLLSSLISRMEE